MVKFGKRIAYTKSYGKGMRSMEKGKKKKIAVIVGIIVLIIVIAAVVFAFYANSKKSSAEDAALQHAGVTRQEAAMLQSELDFKGFSIVCDVSFKTSDYDYDYEVSLPGLEILDFEKEYYGVPSLPQSDSSSGGQENGTSAQQSDQSAAAGTAVSEASAKETVFAHAGVAEADVLFYRSHIDTDHGSSRYEIEFTAGGYEYDYEVDCMSGEILKFEKDKIR